MPVSQSRLLILLTSSLLSTTGLADSVTVNTAIDENNIDNQSCSLREAVSYLNEKNVKKAINNEEVAVIAGTSAVVRNQLNTAQQELIAEQAKISPDTAKIAQLNTQINQLTTQINVSLAGLNSQLNQVNDDLKIEESKANPDTALITTYKTNIEQLKKDVETKTEEKVAKEKELKDYRNTGLFGCASVDENSADALTLLNLPNAYLLNSPITINLNLTFNAIPLTNIDGTASTLEDNTSIIPLRPIIKANGTPHSLFVIDDGIDNSTAQSITVTFNNIDFMGCDQLCATNGGILLNKENLTITNSVISKGQANYGGAIYNSAQASLAIQQGVLKENQVFNDGAAIFSENNNISIERTLITQNKATTISNSIITIGSIGYLNLFIPHIENSTLSGNEGTAISAESNIFITNNTIVNNTIGVRLNNKLPFIYNSIIAGNSQADCNLFAAIPSDDNVYFANNLSVQNKGCPTGFANNNNQTITNTGNETLFAALDNNNHCAAPPAVGLLCPLGEFGGLTKTHKPRLLASYTKLTDSPIVNKGFYNNNITNKGLLCNTIDQRGFTRENNENRCDIGAVEIQTGLLSYTQGDDITYGQVKRFSPIINLADAELLPAANCASVLGAGDYLDGCLRLVDFPQHGKAIFDPQNSDILYSTNNPEFHGFDKFSYSIVTTLSRFSDAINDRTLKTNVKVVSEPPESMSSKALDSGSMNIFSLLILSSFFAVWRRARRG